VYYIVSPAGDWQQVYCTCTAVPMVFKILIVNNEVPGSTRVHINLIYISIS
jgi:hypothetical protein